MIGLYKPRLGPMVMKSKSLMIGGLQDIRHNLILDFDFETFLGAEIIDQSTEKVNFTNSGATKANGIGNGRALSFDGSDDHCFQKVYASETGTVSINVTNGSAALTDSGQDFTNYIGNGTDNKYMVAVKDEESDIKCILK